MNSMRFIQLTRNISRIFFTVFTEQWFCDDSEMTYAFMAYMLSLGR